MWGRLWAAAALAIALSFVSAPTATSAAMTSGSDTNFSWTIDTATGLEWLDFDGGPAPSTINRSYNDVAAQLASGGEFAGWRFASRAEVNQFILNITGLPYLIFNGTSPQQDGATAMVAAWTGYTEATGVKPSPFVVHGFTGDIYDSNPLDNNPAEGVYYFGLFDYYPDSRTQDYTVAVSSGVNDDEIYQGFGSWLVRGGAVNGVPEPPTLALLGLGLAGLAAMRRYRRHLAGLGTMTAGWQL